MIDKIVPSVESALADVRDGSTILVGGFGGAGVPEELVDALIAQGAKDLTIVNNNAGNGEIGIAALFKGRARAQAHLLVSPGRSIRIISRRPTAPGRSSSRSFRRGLSPSACARAGAGIAAFFTPTGHGTDLAKGKENARHRRQGIRARARASRATWRW